MSETQDIKKEESFNTSTPLLSTLPSLVLNGIFFKDDQAYALINNQVFKENDAINGARIIAIHPDSVDLVFEGRNFTLRIE
ncbi:MAG: general secretion pathway protein GspB, partial [Candidatus Omnitrophota bacterium]